MSWDRQTLEAEIQNEVDDFEADSLTVIRQAINDTSRTIWFRHDWTFKDATAYLDTDGIASAFLVTTQVPDWSKIHQDGVGFKNTGETGYRSLSYVPYDQFLRLYNPTNPSVGPPTIWTLFAGQIIFNTIPPALTDSIKLTYAVDFVELQDDDDVPLIPEKYKHVIKSGVKAIFFDFDDDLRADPERRKFEGQSYEKGVGGLIGDMILEDNEQVTGSHDQNVLGQRRVLFGGRR